MTLIFWVLFSCVYCCLCCWQLYFHWGLFSSSCWRRIHTASEEVLIQLCDESPKSNKSSSGIVKCDSSWFGFTLQWIWCDNAIVEYPVSFNLWTMARCLSFDPRHVIGVAFLLVLLLLLVLVVAVLPVDDNTGTFVSLQSSKSPTKQTFNFKENKCNWLQHDIWTHRHF